MSSLEADKVVLTVSVLNSKFEVDSEYAKISNYFATCVEGGSTEVDVQVLKGMKKPEVAIKGIIDYMNITKGIRQDLVPQPLKEVIPEEKGMRAYVCNLRDTPAPEIDDDEEEKAEVLCATNEVPPSNIEPIFTRPTTATPKQEEVEITQPRNFELADFIDTYVEENGMLGLYEMIGYSNYLGIKPLLYLCCAKMALMMKDKSLEEIKTLVESGL